MAAGKAVTVLSFAIQLVVPVGLAEAQDLRPAQSAIVVVVASEVMAILNASGRVNGAYYLDPKLSPDTRTAILAACRALAEDAARAMRQSAMDECNKQKTDFLSPGYATGQPFSSHAERFACGQCHDAIRAIDPASVIAVTPARHTTEATDLVERVAIAIGIEYLGSDLVLDDNQQTLRQIWVRLARAAIAAMQPVMKEAIGPSMDIDHFLSENNRILRAQLAAKDAEIARLQK